MCGAKNSTTAVAAEETDPTAPPLDKNSLQRWVHEQVGVLVPEGAPLDYLAHAFFEGGETWPGVASKHAAPEDGGLKVCPAEDSAVDLEESPGGGSTNAAEARSPDCVVWACRGGGKTFLAALATALDLHFKPGIEVRLLAGSLEQGGRMYEHLRRVLAKPIFCDGVKWSGARRVDLKNGSRAALLAQSEASVRGTRVQKVRCDEVELFAREIWEAVQLTTRSAVCGGVPVRGAVEALSTMHKPFGLMSALVEEAKGGGAGRRLFRWGLADVLDLCGNERQCRTPAGPCPLSLECAGRAKELKLPGNRRKRGFVAIADAIGMKTRVDHGVWNSEMLCLKVSRADTVFPEFDPETHVFDGDASVWCRADGAARFIGGMDFGFRAPTVVLWGALDAGGVLRIVGERWERQAILAEHIGAIRNSSWPALDWIGVDPAGLAVDPHTGESTVRALRRAGLVVRHGRSELATGLPAVRARLKPADGSPARLLIHKHCPRLIEALTKYHYDPDNPHSPEPVKDGNDHAADALRYMVVNLDKHEGTRFGWYA